MATKWKNKCKMKYILWVLLCVIPAVILVSAYPHVRQQSEKESKKYYTTQEFVEYLLNGNQVLYEEIQGANVKDLYPPENSFLEVRPYLQYEVLNKSGKTLAKNGESLEKLLEKNDKKAYDWIVKIEYDSLGNAEVTECHGTYAQQMKVRLTKAMYVEEYDTAGENIETPEEMGTPAGCTFLYGMTKTQAKAYQEYAGNNFYGFYYVNGMADMSWMMALTVIGAAILLPFVKVLHTGKEKYFQMPVEVIGIAAIGVLMLWEVVKMLTINTISRDVQGELMQFGVSAGNAESIAMAWNLIVWIFCFGLVYWVAASARSLFGMHWKEILNERVLLLPFFRKHRSKLEKGYSFLREKGRKAAGKIGKFFQIDLKEQSNKVIFRFVTVQFVLMSLLCMGWFFGIAGVLIYSVILFRILYKRYAKIRQDYQKMLQATERIAAGNLDISMEQDFGIFEPVRQQLLQIQSGFKSAVEEEVKSQRMKTELITNVSHDLKTPLTAIITYVNLLKEEGITEEERENYIDVLERKSMRLKVLIEDLFEVSKATSKNVKLELANVDIISLLKQVRSELGGQIEKSGLDFRWKLPEEKVYLTLDGQKTYRVFENLLVNILKYALQGTRVYIDVEDVDDIVTVTMKNISRGELNFDPGEITERFVRGDVSRNTEGSGLGLAIVKSFVELQRGKLSIEVNGDLFVARIQWNRKDMESVV